MFIATFMAFYCHVKAGKIAGQQWVTAEGNDVAKEIETFSIIAARCHRLSSTCHGQSLSQPVWQWQWLCQALCRVALWGSLNNMLIDSLSQLSTRHPSKQTEKWLPYAHTHTNTHAHTHVWLHMSVLAKEWPRMELRIGIGIGIR